MAALLEKENRIIDCILSTVFAAGYEVSIFDGEEFILRRSSDVDTIKEALNSSGMDWLRVLKKDDPYQIGSILLIYNNGNDGLDLIANTASGDHAAFDDLLNPVYELVDSMADES